ncbi:MAG: sugar phosphate isomerase/epimerase [Fimbriimonadaceae bacterium]|nr:sugar phosphate isomerase/epimerase [Chthonomonadaceae bacterium]MCO5295587.1 sugar phosphate isomerase/epimerase [Fimbriimonadaceae bacterium]
MKLAVSMYSYYRTVRDGGMDLPGFIREAKKIGADGVELLDFFYKDVESDRRAALDALTETGLPCPIFSVAQNFAKPLASERAHELEKIRFGIEEAGHFGAGVVRVFAGDVSPGVTFDEARAWIVEGLSEASKFAADAGVKLALENHGKLAGRGEQVRGLIEDVRAACGNDALGANPDTGNFLLVDQASHDAIAEVARLANMVHFKDFTHVTSDYTGHVFESLGGARYAGAAVGEGVVDLEACVDALRSAGFDGWLSIEFEGEEDPLAAVPRCVANARRYL